MVTEKLDDKILNINWKHFTIVVTRGCHGNHNHSFGDIYIMQLQKANAIYYSEESNNNEVIVGN